MEPIEVAFRLFIGLPFLFFEFLLKGHQPGFTTFGVVTWVAIVSLVIGLILGYRSKHRGLLWFFLPVLLIHLFVAVAGYFRGQLEIETIGYANTAFVVAEVLILAGLLFRLRGARLPAALLSVFCIGYALPAMFIAGMSFTDTWL